MALPKLMRDIFANDGAGPLFRKDRIPTIGEADVPSIFVKVAKQTFTDAQKKQARTNIGADAIPPGTMMAYGGKSIPDGWLLCNGALVSRTTYARLFAAIGTAWGAGDGSTTFKLPNADGRVMQGVTDASKVGQYLEAGLPNITGEMTFHGAFTDNTGGTCLYLVNGCFSGVDQQTKYGHASLDAYATSLKTARLSGELSNSCFGKSSVVQVPAFQTLIIIKA